MKSPFCEMFGLDMPLFAFSHCPDVVVEVSKAGGLYRAGSGRIVTQWPHTMAEYGRRKRLLDPEAYAVG